MPLTRFASNGQTFDFTTWDVLLQTYTDNFAELVTRTRRMPGAHGGFDELGEERSLSEIGTIRQQIFLVAEDEDDMQPKRDALKAMADWGVGVLYNQPRDPNLVERFCRVRVNNVSLSEQVHMHTELHQPASIIWQAADPFWCTPGNGIVWGQGDPVNWGEGASVKWGGGSGTTITGSGTLALTNNGSAFTLPTLSLTVPTAKSVHEVIIRRLVNGAIRDEVRYRGVLAAGDYLFIDAKRLGVWLNGYAVYGSLFSAKTASWMRLLPGSNSLEVLFGEAADQAVVRVNYQERYT